MELDHEEQTSPVTVKKRVSKIEKQTKAITDQTVPTQQPKPASKKVTAKIEIQEPKSPVRKTIIKEKSTKERAESEPPPGFHDKKLLNNVQLLRNALDDLYRAKRMNQKQASEYLKYKDMLTPSYKFTPGETKMTKVQIRQTMKPLYLEIIGGT